MKRSYWLSLVGLLLFGSLRVFGAQITTDYDHSINFSQYKTYSWLKVQAGDSLWEDRIKQDIDAQLAAKGWTRVDANGSATIAAFQSTHDQQTLDTLFTYTPLARLRLILIGLRSIISRKMEPLQMGLARFKSAEKSR